MCVCVCVFRGLQTEELQRKEFVDAISGRFLPVTRSLFEDPLGYFQNLRGRSSFSEVSATATPPQAPRKLEPAPVVRTPKKKKKKTGQVIMFKYVRFGGLYVYGSFKGQRSLEDIPGVTIKIHSRWYHSRSCTMEQMVLKLRNDVILDVLRQACAAVRCARMTRPSVPCPALCAGWPQHVQHLEVHQAAGGHLWGRPR